MPWRMFATSHETALLLWLDQAKLAYRDLICIQKVVLFIMRYP